LGQGIDDVPTLFFRGCDERADDGEVAGALFGAESTGDFLSELHHAAACSARLLVKVRDPTWLRDTPRTGYRSYPKKVRDAYPTGCVPTVVRGPKRYAMRTYLATRL